MSTPKACKRASPIKQHKNVRNEQNSAHRVHSNLGSANNSFLNPSAIPSCGIDTKWNQLSKITQGGAQDNKHNVRNHPLRNPNGGIGRTHDFGSSLSAQEKKRIKKAIKDHKLSCDSSLLKNNLDRAKFTSSPAQKPSRKKGSSNTFCAELTVFCFRQKISDKSK